MYNLALIYVRLRTGGTYTPYQHHCQVSSNFTAKTILSPLGLERKVMASKNKSTLTLKGLSTSSGREQLLSTLGSPYSQLPDIKLSLPYPLQCFSKCLQDSVDMHFRPSCLTSHPDPTEDAHWATQKHFLAEQGISSSFSPSGFPHALGGPSCGDPSPLTWGPFPAHRTQALGQGLLILTLEPKGLWLAVGRVLEPVVCVCVSRPVLSDSLQLHRPQPTSFSVHGILQARILERITIPFSTVCICEYLHGEDP